MSMPQFPPGDTVLSRDEAINAILTSIAMEESALSHIINAEGEKIQYALKHVDADSCCKSVCRILEVNDSVTALVDQITDLQLLLKSKLRIAASLIEDKPKCPDKPHKPCPDRPHNREKPCKPSPPPCTSRNSKLI